MLKRISGFNEWLGKSLLVGWSLHWDLMQRAMGHILDQGEWDMGTFSWDHCSILNEKCLPNAHVFEYLVPDGSYCSGLYGTFKRYGIIEGRMFLWVDFESLSPFPILSLCLIFVVRM